MTTKQATRATATSDKLVYNIMQKGFERSVIYSGAGILAGAMASIVLARGGQGTAARKAITAFGGGVGLGSGWTSTSRELEDLLDKSQ